MPFAETAPAPQPEMQEVATEHFPHFGIPDFEKLPTESQNLYLKIPADRLDATRPLIEREIAKVSEASERKERSTAKKSEGRSIETTATNRETQAISAIDAFHRADNGDKQAKKELQDHKKELLGEKSSDEETFKMMLENESGDPFAQDMIIEIMLSDETSEAHQKVLDLFKDYRGDLASVDDALSPKLQIEFFAKLTQGQGSFRQRLEFGKKALEWVMSGNVDNLFEAFHARKILDGPGLNDNAIEELQKGARHVMEHGATENIKAA